MLFFKCKLLILVSSSLKKIVFSYQASIALYNYDHLPLFQRMFQPKSS